jgi:hypothetical protein
MATAVTHHGLAKTPAIQLARNFQGVLAFDSVTPGSSLHRSGRIRRDSSTISIDICVEPSPLIALIGGARQ